MKILFMGKDEVDLYETLMNSDTSRIILRFYAPRRHACGVFVSVSSLGIALSLVSELRWYVRRYMAEVLFELQEGIFGTYALAREVYERDIHLRGEGIRKSLYGIRGSRVDRIVCLEPGTSHTTSDELSAMDEVMEVWSLEKDIVDVFDDHVLPDEPGENALSE
jgi:hypothetical protein